VAVHDRHAAEPLLFFQAVENREDRLLVGGLAGELAVSLFADLETRRPDALVVAEALGDVEQAFERLGGK